jgi:short-subunit dehydrogenase
MDRVQRSAEWSAALLGLAGLGFVLARRQRDSRVAKQLRGKVVLVTGGSRGLGFAIAQQLASLGTRLVLTSRHGEELERAKARLVDTGYLAHEDIFIQSCDVSVQSEIQQVVEEAIAYFGQIDIVVNNAGIMLVGPLESQTVAGFSEAMNINFFGALHTTLSVLPQMLARGEGAIVNIASIGGKVAFPHLLPYVASKFALVGWSQGLRAELAPKGIHVTTVNPGIMRTGSHIQARYTGNREEEYRWFASAASFPGIATDATSAAKTVVNGILRRSAEISIGLPAIAAARLSNLAPELTAGLLSLAAGFLPDPPAIGSRHHHPENGDGGVSGKTYRGSLPAILESFGGTAIRKYNQEPSTEYLPDDTSHEMGTAAGSALHPG